MIGKEVFQMEVQVDRLHRIRPLPPVSIFEDSAKRAAQKDAREERKPLRGTESAPYSVEISAAGRSAANAAADGANPTEGRMEALRAAMRENQPYMLYSAGDARQGFSL